MRGTFFPGITIWWPTQDRSIPIYDAGLHLSLAIQTPRALGAGRPLKALTLTFSYPPFAYLVGSLGSSWAEGFLRLNGLALFPLATLAIALS